MNKQHTYREFLALLPSRPWHSKRKQKYANRLTNYESYYQRRIKTYVEHRNYLEAKKTIMMMSGLDGKKEDEKEDEADARIAVLHMIADDKQGIYGDWEDIQFATIYSLLHPPPPSHDDDRSQQSLQLHVRYFLLSIVSLSFSS